MSGDERCIFCKIACGQLPGEFVHRDESCFVIRDIAPSARVHLLVIPNDHFTHLDNLTEDKKPMVGHMAAVAHRVAAAEGVSESGYRLVVNQREDAGQMVDHLHMHVLGGEKLGSMV